MKTKIGTIDASPAPGALFDEALTNFECAIGTLLGRGGYAFDSKEYQEARAHYEAKRKALTDYVGQLERFYTAHV